MIEFWPSAGIRSAPGAPALIEFANQDALEKEEVVMGENNLKTVKITPGVVHAIKNTGDKDMVLLVYASETFDPNDPDTVFQKILE